LLETIILLAVLRHILEIRGHDRLMAEEMKDLKKLHRELHEALRLLKEDIKELNTNQRETHKAVKKMTEAAERQE